MDYRGGDLKQKEEPGAKAKAGTNILCGCDVRDGAYLEFIHDRDEDEKGYGCSKTKKVELGGEREKKQEGKENKRGCRRVRATATLGRSERCPVPLQAYLP